MLDQANPNVPPELLKFATRNMEIAAIREPTVERRSDQRRSFVSPAVVQPVDGELLPLGPSFAAVTRDLSPQGLGMVFEDLPSHDLFAVQFTVDDQETCLLVRMLWARPMGPFLYVGFHALKVLKELPTAEASCADA